MEGAGCIEGPRLGQGGQAGKAGRRSKEKSGMTRSAAGSREWLKTPKNGLRERGFSYVSRFCGEQRRAAPALCPTAGHSSLPLTVSCPQRGSHGPGWLPCALQPACLHPTRGREEGMKGRGRRLVPGGAHESSGEMCRPLAIPGPADSNPSLPGHVSGPVGTCRVTCL